MNSQQSSESPGVLDAAQHIVDELLSRLRALVETSQQRAQQLTVELRQSSRALDEAVMQHQFAVERNLPTAAALANRVQDLRTTHNRLAREAESYQRSLKQLDQLVRQIDMSSSTLAGNDDSDNADPWIQALRSQVILGLEEERVRLAREVHDSPAQVLANALIGLEKSRSLLQEHRLAPLGSLLDQMCDAVREGLQEVRNFIADLRPGRLDELGLVDALHDYIQRYRDAYGATVSFDYTDKPALPREAEIVLYRVVQESLQNAHKHARGAAVHIHLAVRQQRLLLTIRDEGPGFDPREVAQRAGRKNWGLTSMRERAEMIGATYKVTSRRGHGTEVSVILPFN